MPMRVHPEAAPSGILSRAAALVFVVLLAAAATALRSTDASACALMPIGNAQAPSLASERVLIVYDEERKLEHFVREVRFDDASGTFAFVVPTPERPELAAVESPPFDALARDFPIEPPPEQSAPPPGAKSAPIAAAPEAVQVLSVQQVGKFKAFVLAASDAAALDKWLAEERIALPPGGRAWLAHYVQLRFYFAAFRYDAAAAQAGPPPPPASGGPGQFATPPGPEPAGSPAEVPLAPPPPGVSMTSETVRLTFATAVPYFPYLEPARAARPPGGAANGPHEMHVWLVSGEEREPRLRRAIHGQPTRWGWAWQAGVAYEPRRSEVARTLGTLGKMLPSEEHLHVQTFRDRRVNRDGWGDIVFPTADSELDEPGFTASVAKLLGNLQRLIHTGTLEPSELAGEEGMRVAPSARGCACGASGPRDAGASSWAAALALGLIASCRRRRRAA